MKRAQITPLSWRGAAGAPLTAARQQPLKTPTPTFTSGSSQSKIHHRQRPREEQSCTWNTHTWWCSACTRSLNAICVINAFHTHFCCNSVLGMHSLHALPQKPLSVRARLRFSLSLSPAHEVSGISFYFRFSSFMIFINSYS